MNQKGSLQALRLWIGDRAGVGIPIGREEKRALLGQPSEVASLQVGVMGVASWESGSLISIRWLPTPRANHSALQHRALAVCEGWI